MQTYPTSLASSLPYQSPEYRAYEAALSILSECGIPRATWWGKLAGRDLQDIQDDILSHLSGSRCKLSDDQIIAVVNRTFSNLRPPEPLPMDEPFPEVKEPAPQAINTGKVAVTASSPEPAEADGGDDDGIIAELNKKHAAITASGKFQILNNVIDPTTGFSDVNFSSVTDFRNRYQNTMTTEQLSNGKRETTTYAKKWLNSPRRRTYNGIVFDPSGKQVDGVFNLWQGFALKPIKGQWKRMERHILEVICNNDREVFNYVMAWLARIVQDPGGKKPGVVIVLRGKQGTGKGIFVNNFGMIFGQHFKHIISHHLISGRFNSHFKDSLLVFVDEGFWGGNKEGEGALKGMITEEYIYVEGKGKDAFPIKNHASFFFASNNKWIVPADTEERRFMVLDVSDARMGDAAYFRELNQEMENGGREAMLYDLLCHDITNIDLRAFPRREALVEQIVQSWPTDKQFWFEVLRTGSINNRIDGLSVWPDVIDSDELYNLYCDFATRAGEKYKSIDKMFGKNLKEVCPSIEKKQRGGGTRYYKLPSIEKCRNDLSALLGVEVNWDE